MALRPTLPMNSKQLPISAYLDRLSAFPGEQIDGFVSISCNDGHYDVSLKRMICADANPSGPGITFETIGHASSYQGQYQPIQIGSYATLPISSPSSATGRTWCLLFNVGVVPADRVTLFSDESSPDKFTVSVDKLGIYFDYSGGNEYVAPEHILPNTWYKLLVAVDLLGKTVRVGLGALGAQMKFRDGHNDFPVSQFPESSQLMIAARQLHQPRAFYTGKIEAPAVFNAFLESWPGTSERNSSGLMGAWDFALGIGSSTAYDSGPAKFHGQLHNHPTRGVRGSCWTGREHRWRDAPNQYAAIQFNDDDLDDCKWERSFSFPLPGTLKSGSYALELTAGDEKDWLPFFVRPGRESQKSSVLFIVPTFTYLAYANGRFSNLSGKCRERNLAWSGIRYSSGLYPTYGCSTYDTHSDGSGVCFSSRRRPLLSMRPGFGSMWDARGSGLRHYPADSHLTAWLEAKGISFDCLTDEDLHREGSSALEGYRAVLTGTHPEYHTWQTLQAIEQYIHSGGNLAYLGGNGFYWKIAFDASDPCRIEMRRAEGGIRTWAAEPGEYYNAIDGEMGGLWSRNGRRPQQLVGVGSCAQGPFASVHYERCPDSYRSDVSWVFDGVEGAEFGDYGLSGGGAAGFEVDRAEPKFGSPGTTTVLARNGVSLEGFVPGYEDLLADEWTVSGVSREGMLRSDIALSTTEGGGKVFAVGSITFCGSLWNGTAFEGPVSRILENVLSRFLTTDV